MTDADINFYFDPVYPFAWMTSKWVRLVQSQRDYTVDWRFISLRLVNAEVDYDSHFPPEYEAGHTAGLRLLRVVHRAGPSTAARSSARSTRHWAGTSSTPRPRAPPRHRASSTRVAPHCSSRRPWRRWAPRHLVGALDDDSLDLGIRAETEEALALTGKNVGTPIIHFQPPDGVAFFGPVISRLPSEEDAVRLWDYVLGLAAFPGFAELKRSLRELPQLRGLGVDEGEVGVEQDWHGGSRRSKR